MKIDDLLNISLDEVGINLLVSLPVPNKSPLATANSKELLESCKSFRKLWGELVIDQISLPNVKLHDLPKDIITPSTSEEIWDSLFLTIACYYNYSFLRFAEKEQHDGLPSGLNLHEIGKFLPEEVHEDNIMLYIRFLSYSYYTCLVSLYFAPMFRESMIPPYVGGLFNSTYHKSVSDLYTQCMRLNDRKRNIGLLLLGGVLDYAKVVWEKQPYDKEYRPGKFSAIKTEELSLIASRDKNIAKRYGVKNLEKIFERQLSLIMQSLGMYVVSTRMGIRTVDLICISHLPNQQYTFLIEAKTTNKPYSLPRKDFRALKEYVDDMHRTLDTLPPLRFVLICAKEPSKTLEHKLNEFQRDTGTPIRFINSQQISDLRENIIGPLPADVFANEILSSPNILKKEFVSEVEKKYSTIQKAHTNFVETMFSAKGIIPDMENRGLVDERLR